MATIERRIESLEADTTLPKGLPALVLSLSPYEINDRVPLEWDEGTDELDSYQVAAVKIAPEDARFVLLAYARDPRHTTSVLAEATDTVRDDLAALLDALRIAPDEVIDRAPWAGGRSIDATTLAEASELKHEAAELTDQLSDVQATIANLNRSVAAILAESVEFELTRRQREVLTLSAGGRTQREIADALALSPRTVQRHLQRAMRAIEADTAQRR